MCITQPTTTIDTEYEYDEYGRVKKTRSVAAFSELIPPCTTTVYNGNDNDDDVECGVELDGAIEMSPWETILTAAVGAFLGNVVYRIVRKMIEQ